MTFCSDELYASLTKSISKHNLPLVYQSSTPGTSVTESATNPTITL